MYNVKSKWDHPFKYNTNQICLCGKLKCGNMMDIYEDNTELKLCIPYHIFFNRGEIRTLESIQERYRM